ncbi:mRNA 3'-end-processing protein YTH1 [Scheffersomyces xylosifermentans]|uniref:mRNA 3'-end-processing protein YTH1 n=1 Tax=Scheffersomyces xylosifermentans TaxID=1304137 RepID=UPI00315C6BE0
MLHLNPILHPDTKKKPFKFESFLRKEYNFGLDPDRPVCQFYIPQKGASSCPNGNNCPNKHVSQMYNNKIVCKHWLRGLCKKNDHCEFLHEYNLRKMPECLFFSKNGFCTQTPECLYLHIDPQSKIPECPNYEKGFCPDGPNCTKRHVRKILCPLYLTGFCPKGSECEFTHPKFDTVLGRLRIKPDVKKILEDAKKAEEEAEELKKKAEEGEDKANKKRSLEEDGAVGTPTKKSKLE